MFTHSLLELHMDLFVSLPIRTKLFCDSDPLDAPTMNAMAIFDDQHDFGPKLKASKDETVSTQHSTRKPTRSTARAAPTETSSAKRFLGYVDEGRNLIGDGSKNHCLPLVPGKHGDLTCISPDIVADVLRGTYDEEIGEVTIVDCRYPYEFNGGHIQGAINIYTQKGVRDFIRHHRHTNNVKRSIIIFHCEFSSKRGPNICRYMRNQDRKMNKENYPKLFFPEIYLLGGGYEKFFSSQHHDMCYPEAYVKMLDEKYSFELSHFRCETKRSKSDKRSHSRLFLRVR